MVSRLDFLASLNNDIKPVSSRSEDILLPSIFVAFYLCFFFLKENQFMYQWCHFSFSLDFWFTISPSFLLSRRLVPTRRTTPATSWTGSSDGATRCQRSWRTGSCWCSRQKTATAHRWSLCCWKVTAYIHTNLMKVKHAGQSQQTIGEHNNPSKDRNWNVCGGYIFGLFVITNSWCVINPLPQAHPAVGKQHWQLGSPKNLSSPS